MAEIQVLNRYLFWVWGFLKVKLDCRNS